MTIPRIKPDIVPIDLDFPKETLPAVSTCAVGREMCDNKAYLQTVELGRGQRALRVQFHSEVPGLWGREGRGWSHYAIYLEDGGKIYARRAKSSRPEQDSQTKYSLANPKWKKAPQRVTDVIAEVVAGWETIQQLRSPSQVAQNPLYQLALWMERNRTKAIDKVPAHLLGAITYLPNHPISIDLDDNSKAGFPPSLGVVTTAYWMTNDHVTIESLPIIKENRLRFHFASEVPLREFGSQPPADPAEAAKPDRPAPAVIDLSAEGIRITYAPSQGTLEYAPSVPTDRLAIILAGALVAAGTRVQPLFEYSTEIVRSSPIVVTEGEPLPSSARFEPGDALFKMSPAESATNLPIGW